jgi:hypothetical protein
MDMCTIAYEERTSEAGGDEERDDEQPGAKPGF